MQFGDLRNALAHGDPIRPSAFSFGCDYHFWIAERRLRQVITKSLIAHTGLSELELEPAHRAFARAHRDALE